MRNKVTGFLQVFLCYVTLVKRYDNLFGILIISVSINPNLSLGVGLLE